MLSKLSKVILVLSILNFTVALFTREWDIASGWFVATCGYLQLVMRDNA